VTAWILIAGVAFLAALGLYLLSRPARMTDEEYEARKGKGSGVGNALLELQSILEPGKGDALRKAKTEQHEEADPGGDPPEPPGRPRA